MKQQEGNPPQSAVGVVGNAAPQVAAERSDSRRPLQQQRRSVLRERNRRSMIIMAERLSAVMEERGNLAVVPEEEARSSDSEHGTPGRERTFSIIDSLAALASWAGGDVTAAEAEATTVSSVGAGPSSRSAAAAALRERLDADKDDVRRASVSSASSSSGASERSGSGLSVASTSGSSALSVLEASLRRAQVARSLGDASSAPMSRLSSLSRASLEAVPPADASSDRCSQVLTRTGNSSGSAAASVVSSSLASTPRGGLHTTTLGSALGLLPQASSLVGGGEVRELGQHQ
eukprot:TRINITY_DN33760_c0_g1_i1.p1 TRINITY_DN33760_c0_g1~~TRINITY_DN33760_c0_g1_i1.p1  ORF type:complete len:290 (+),score=70.15 TRINITY_DN33760_c0_g1_i1:104-973(+)